MKRVFQEIKNPIIVLKNGGQTNQLMYLLQFRNLVVSQLFVMSKTGVTKTLFDGIHQSMLVLQNQSKKIIGGICFYEIFKHKCVSIIYFVVHPAYQAKNYGTYLMRNFKDKMRNKEYKLIATQADTISLNFYYKNGFFEFKKYNKKMQHQPTQYSQIAQNEQQQGENYKKYLVQNPWLEYIEQYYSSVLLIYKIPPKLNFFKCQQIINLQKLILYRRLNKKMYRNFRFLQQTLELIAKTHRQKYQRENCVIFDKKKIESLQQQIKLEKVQFKSCKQRMQLTQQIALLGLLKNHKSSWILKMNFIKLPGAVNDSLSNLNSINKIQESIVNRDYKSTLQMCADITKLFENLKLFLVPGSNYYTACLILQTHISKYITQICQGTFKPYQHLDSQ